MFTAKRVLVSVALAIFAFENPANASRVKSITIDEAPRAAALALEIGPALAKLEARLLRDWPQDSTKREALLVQVHAEIEEVLKAPELAAARDYVLAEEGGMSPVAAYQTSAWPVVFARFRPDEPSAPGGRPQGTEDRRGERLAARIAEVRRHAEDNDLLISICAATVPKPKSSFRLWPQSYLEGARETATPGTVQVFRGYYSYRAVERSKKRKIECDRAVDPTCAPLDLMTDSRPGVLCDFDQETCSRRRESAEKCPE